MGEWWLGKKKLFLCLVVLLFLLSLPAMNTDYSLNTIYTGTFFFLALSPFTYLRIKLLGKPQRDRGGQFSVHAECFVPCWEAWNGVIFFSYYFSVANYGLSLTVCQPASMCPSSLLCTVKAAPQPFTAVMTTRVCSQRLAVCGFSLYPPSYHSVSTVCSSKCTFSSLNAWCLRHDCVEQGIFCWILGVPLVTSGGETWRSSHAAMLPTSPIFSFLFYSL